MDGMLPAYGRQLFIGSIDGEESQAAINRIASLAQYGFDSSGPCAVLPGVTNGYPHPLHLHACISACHFVHHCLHYSCCIPREPATGALFTFGNTNQKVLAILTKIFTDTNQISGSLQHEHGVSQYLVATHPLWLDFQHVLLWPSHGPVDLPTVPKPLV